MSLIEKATTPGKHRLRMSETAGKKQGPPMLMKTTDFMSTLREIYDSSVVDKKSKKEFKDYRMRLRHTVWPLVGVMNKVDAKSWREMCEDTMKDMIKNIRNSQPNGEWKLFDYEVDIRPYHNGVESIILACEWVDVENKPDLRYSNGVPAVDVNINVADNNKELIEALTKKNDSSNDSELKDLMKQFIAVMAGKALDDNKTAQPEAVAEEPAVKSDEFDDNLSEGFDG